MTADIVKLASSRERPAVRACMDCAHLERGISVHVACCLVNGAFIETERHYGHCGPEGRLWEPRPPRRSLARWIYDTFICMEDGK